jgi:hypothetical protein
MRSFNMRKFLCLAIVGGSACSVALSAHARQIPFQTPAQLKSTCVAAGGDYGAPGKNGAYFCQLKDGNVISCGGVGAHAKTCSNPAPRAGGGPRVVTTGGVLGGKPVNGQPAPKGPVLGKPAGTNGGGLQVVKPFGRR